MTITIDQKRLAKVRARGLSKGIHRNFADGICAMEAAAYVASEPWSDHPECVSPVIGAFLRNWNDNLDEDDRNRLITPELIVRTVGTRGSSKLEERRSLMAADWLVRVHTPAWLRLAKLDAQADLLEALPEITDMAQVTSIRQPLEAVRKDADAALAAAGADAWYAAWDAAWTAAGYAALAAAGAAAWYALSETKSSLQISAQNLVERMCDLQEAA